MRSTNIVGVLLLLLSMGIAGVAAYFSITGLAKLFAAALIPVIIMAGILEAGKLGGTFFLHRYWKELPFWKWLLGIMVAVLMLVTSMGIFGFLSKGHLEQEAPAHQAVLQIERLDSRIKSHEIQIERDNKRLVQLDAVIQKLLDFDKVSGPTGSRSVRKEQAPERLEIQESVDNAYVSIDALREDLLEYNQQITTIEAELGPITYVAELFGFDLETGDGKGKAVRFVIVLLMAAFDPLAIILIMAADWVFLKDNQEQREKTERIERKRREEEDRIKRVAREEEEEYETKAEAKREKVRIKKEEKDKIDTAKKEAAIARKDAREREKEMEALALENEAKRLDLERKRIENDNLRINAKTIVKTVPEIIVTEEVTEEIFDNEESTISIPTKEETIAVDLKIEEPPMLMKIAQSDTPDTMLSLLTALKATQETSVSKELSEEIVEPAEDDPLSFLGKSFENDEQLIKYLLINEDVFQELINLSKTTTNNNTKESIDKIINIVYTVKSNKNKGWLD